eukprot:m.31083 g.31083  ORF g.31083 m.31083 type:complete len:521 (-) comp13944_c0_seq3:1862-3424(-)
MDDDTPMECDTGDTMDCTDSASDIAIVGEFDNMERIDQISVLHNIIARLGEAPDGREVLMKLHRLTSEWILRDFVICLPEEISLHIMSFLDLKSLLNASMVSRAWKSIAESDQLWKRICYQKNIQAHVAIDCDARLFTGQFTRWKKICHNSGRFNVSWRDHGMQRTPHPEKIQCHPQSVVTGLCLAGPNRVISCSDDTSLKVWQVQPPEVIHTLNGHTGGVWSCAVDGDIAVSGATDHDLRVWDIRVGSCLGVLSGHSSTVRCVAIKEDIVVSGSRDNTVRVWSTTTLSCLRMFEGHTDAVRCIALLNNTVASGSYDQTVRLWKIDNGQCIVLEGHQDKVYCLEMTSKYVASGSWDQTIRVWDAFVGKLLVTLRGHDGLTCTMHINGDMLLSGNADCTMKIWDISAGKCIRTLESHSSSVTDVQLTKKFIISCSDDGTVKLWKRNGQYLRDLVDINDLYDNFAPGNGVIWRLQCTETSMICAIGGRLPQEMNVTSLLFQDFTPCDNYDRVPNRPVAFDGF